MKNASFCFFHFFSFLSLISHTRCAQIAMNFVGFIAHNNDRNAAKVSVVRDLGVKSFNIVERIRAEKIVNENIGLCISQSKCCCFCWLIMCRANFQTSKIIALFSLYILRILYLKFFDTYHFWIANKCKNFIILAESYF